MCKRKHLENINIVLTGYLEAGYFELFEPIIKKQHNEIITSNIDN